MLSHHLEISLSMIYSRGDRSCTSQFCSNDQYEWGRRSIWKAEVNRDLIKSLILLESHKNFSPKDKENQDHTISLYYITVLSNVLSLFNALSQSSHHISVPYFCVNKWMSYTLYLLHRWRTHWLSKGIMQITEKDWTTGSFINLPQSRNGGWCSITVHIVLFVYYSNKCWVGERL